MKQLKIFIIAGIALCFAPEISAQTSKSKKEKTENHKHVASFQCPMKCEGEKTYNHAGKCPICKMNLRQLESKKEKYQCPMKCEGEKTYDKAGKCPICKMNLKKLESKNEKFQCPMKCEGEKTYDKAGKCPVCNMNLKALPQKSKSKKKVDTAHLKS